MSEVAHYSFLPWVRQGLAAHIQEQDTLGGTPGDALADERAAISVSILLEEVDKDDDSRQERDINRNVALIGPADIVGIEPTAILRTEPRANITNFEANNLVYIEFYEEDFPWRYTPANPANSGISARRLRPWLALIVLKEEEFGLQPAREGMNSIKIRADIINDVFHEHTEHWAWAHVQLNFKTANTSGSALTTEVDGALENDPDIGFSRLLCPRKLIKSTAYSAFLIPTFEAGRLAGLGESTTGIKAQASSWVKAGMPHSEVRPNEYPIYYHWNFKTGAAGDFESLVSQLVPTITDPETGQRPMAIDNPGFGLERAEPESKTLGLQGALRPPNFQPAVWPGQNKPGNRAYMDKLRDIVNLSVDMQRDDNNVQNTENPFYSSSTKIGDDPIITPPLYGQWHALVERLGQQGAPAWLNTLNLDPRFRAVAGLGTKVVQKHQDKLMHQAWQQVSQINEANQRIKEAELSKMVGVSLFAKHLGQQSEDRFVSLTSAMHTRVLNSSGGITVQQRFRESRLPLAAKSAAFKRVTRPGQKKNKQLNKLVVAGSKLHQHIVTNFNKETGAVTVASLKSIPPISLALNTVSAGIDFAIAEYQANDSSVAKEQFIKVIENANLDSINTLRWKQELTALNLSPGVHTIINRLIDNITLYERTSEGYLDVFIETAVFTEIYGEAANLKSSKNGVIRVRRELEIDENLKAESSTTLEEIQQFQSLFTDFSTNTAGILQAPTLKARIDNSTLNQITLDLKQQFNPRYSISRRISRHIKVLTQDGAKPIEQLKPIMAHPVFPEATYEWLSDLSQDYILPNVEEMPNNSITILETNPSFIEAFLAGLNHEMSRELLWREYPTDQRGTYFRQFWDIKDDLFATDKEQQLDIQKMHNWKKGLGQHPMRPGNSSYLVLAVRGELFLKYPNTMVYAHKAQYGVQQDTAPRELTPFNNTNVKFPLFQAQLEPDIYLFGFDLDTDTAKGHRGDTDPGSVGGTLDPGWFFVFKERPGQVSFGFDDYTGPLGQADEMPPDQHPATWNDMAWEYLVNDKKELENYQINFFKNIAPTELPADQANPSWNNDAADLASILYQNPLLFARHAQEMLPESLPA